MTKYIALENTEMLENIMIFLLSQHIINCFQYFIN